MSGAKLNIRPYQSNDEHEVIKLWKECGLVVPWNDPRLDIKRKSQVRPELFLVGELDGQIVASVMGGYEGHRGWINYLAVKPKQQRRGFGKLMMTAIEKALQQTDCPKINLQVRENNHNVIKFYEAIGYKNDHVISFGKRLQTDCKATE